MKDDNKKKIRKILGAFLSIAILAGLSAGLVILYRHPPSFLKVKEVAVITPLKHLNEHDLIRLSEIKKGDNMLRLNLSQIRSNLLRYPWIKEVRISKRVPGRILLWIEEEEPVALMETSDLLYFVNQEGKVFKTLEGKDPKDFPIITGISAQEIKAQLPRMIRFMKSMENSNLLVGLGISEMHWSEKTGLTVFTREPCIRLELGEDRDELFPLWEERIQKFSQMWETIQSRVSQPKVVDLSIDRKVLVRQDKRLNDILTVP
jgi:cell division protein FtsQ